MRCFDGLGRVLRQAQDEWGKFGDEWGKFGVNWAALRGLAGVLRQA